MNEIIWPDVYEPGTTDNFVFNEAIVPGLSAARVWPYLADAAAWSSYYDNASDVRVDGGDGTVLRDGTRFRFTTFGFAVEGEVTECEPPAHGRPGRIAWHGWVEAEPDGGGDARLDVHHAWLVKDLPGNRVRVLTQETQTGAPARAMATTRPNPMLNAHQAWIDGLLRTASTAIRD